MSRFQPVNTQVLRLKRGWSQKELAERAGYTDRLVRKAEFGGKLDVETIRNIAEALSTLEETITIDLLTNDVLSIAKKFTQFFDELGLEMVSAIHHYIAPNFVLHVTSSDESLPLKGTWMGLQGLQAFLELFFGTFTRDSHLASPHYAIGNDFVVATYLEKLYTSGRSPEVLQVYRHFRFRNGLLCRIDDLYENTVASG
jgi:transcriptional regulator with XRE-family HTH domain